jgi:hypothetical protein
MENYSVIDKICLLVSEFNYLFGVINYTYKPENSGVQIDKFNVLTENFNKKQVELRFKLIKEESDELFEAFGKKDKIEIVDALCDILYVVAGAKVYFNLPNGEIDTKLKSENIIITEKPINNINSFEIIELILEDENRFNDLEHEVNLIIQLNKKLEKITESIIMPDKEINLDEKIIEYNNLLDNIIHQVMIISYKLKINIYDLFVLVHESNMSKVCVDFETAIKSVDYYKTIEKRYRKPEYKEIIFNSKRFWVIYDDETKKILKSINYKPVNFFI